MVLRGAAEPLATGIVLVDQNALCVTRCIPPPHQGRFFVGPNDDFRTVWIPLMPIDQMVGGLARSRRDREQERHPQGAQAEGVPWEDTTKSGWAPATSRAVC